MLLFTKLCAADLPTKIIFNALLILTTTAEIGSNLNKVCFLVPLWWEDCLHVMSFSKAPPWSHQSDRRADSASTVVPWGKYWGGSTSLTHREASQRSSFPIPPLTMSHMLRCPQVLSLSLPSSLTGKKTARSWAAQVPSPTPRSPSDSILILKSVAPCHLPQKSYFPSLTPLIWVRKTPELSGKDGRSS